MIIAFDDDATVYPPSLSFFGATTWTWAFSEAFVGAKIIELTLSLYSRTLLASLYRRDLITSLPSRITSLKIRTKL